MKELRFGPRLGGRDGPGLWTRRQLGSLGVFGGEGSCQTEAEGNEAEAAEKRGAPPLRHSGVPMPPLPLQPPALPCLPAVGRLWPGPTGPLGSGTEPWPLWGEVVPTTRLGLCPKGKG